jgi:non-ribosomal peptide synthetase-like protein
LIWVVVYLALGAAGCLLTLVVKWALIGRYAESASPLWSNFVWRNELIVGLCESFTDPFIVNFLRGTPWLVVWMRALGAHIGAFVWLNSVQITEFDLVLIGNEAAIGKDSTMQSHLFEDRVMKTSDVVIGDRCSLGEMSVVLYDSFPCHALFVSCSVCDCDVLLWARCLALLDRRVEGVT